MQQFQMIMQIAVFRGFPLILFALHSNANQVETFSNPFGFIRLHIPD